MDMFERLLGPRPVLTLDIEQGCVTALWINGRRPNLIIRDFDLGAGVAEADRDFFDLPYVPINWTLPPWRLGLALAPEHILRMHDVI